VKQLGRGIDHPPQSSAEVKERVELYLYSPSGPSVNCTCYGVFIFRVELSKKNCFIMKTKALTYFKPSGTTCRMDNVVF
jgi:hypothetical protein